MEIVELEDKLLLRVSKVLHSDRIAFGSDFPLGIHFPRNALSERRRRYHSMPSNHSSIFLSCQDSPLYTGKTVATRPGEHGIGVNRRRSQRYAMEDRDHLSGREEIPIRILACSVRSAD